MEMTRAINIGAYAKKLIRIVFLSILLVFLGGNSFSLADYPHCNVKGSLCVKVLAAYGTDAQRENAVLDGEHFCDFKIIKTGHYPWHCQYAGHCRYASEPEHKRYGKLVYEEENDYGVSGRLSQRQTKIIEPQTDVKKESKVFEFIYNKDGKLIKIHIKSNITQEKKYDKYEYDSSERLSKKSHFIVSPSKGESLVQYTVIKYDLEGKVEKETDLYDKDKELASRTFDYDSKGRLKRKTQIQKVKVQNTDQWKKTQYTYTYDEKGRLLKEEVEANFGRFGIDKEFRKKILYYEYPPFSNKK